MNSTLTPGSGIQLLWGVQLSPDTSLWGCCCLYGTHISLTGAGLDFHPQKEELGAREPGGSSRECSQAQVSAAPGVQFTSCSSPSLEPSRGPFSLPSWLLKQMLKKHLGCLDMVGSKRRPDLGPGRVRLKQHCTQHSNLNIPAPWGPFTPLWSLLSTDQFLPKHPGLAKGLGRGEYMGAEGGRRALEVYFTGQISPFWTMSEGETLKQESLSPQLVVEKPAFSVLFSFSELEREQEREQERESERGGWREREREGEREKERL